MSTTDTRQSLPVPVEVPGQTKVKFARANAPIVPAGSVTGRSLTFVITIMSFLAALTAGGVYLVFSAATLWTNNIASEITVQVQNRGGDAGDGKIAEIVKFLNDQNGIKQVVPYTRERSLKLVEPSIGKSEVLKSFAIPRLIAVEIDRDNPPEIAMLKKVLEAKYPGAVLDDHGLWRGEIHRLTRFLELAGIAMLALMAAATAAVIIAAATSALASNREIVSVLNLVGAEEKLSPTSSRRISCGLASRRAWRGRRHWRHLPFWRCPAMTESMGSSAAAEAEIRRLVGAGTLDWGGYTVLAMVVVVVALICKMTSRYGVRRILNQQNA